MQMRFGFFIGLAALCAAWVLHPAPAAAAADCSKGSMEEQVACLNRAVAELTAKVEALTRVWPCSSLLIWA